MFKNLSFVVFVMILVFFQKSNAQHIGSGVISGYITNDSTKKPVEDANVFISNSILGASTNKHGYYKITNVPAGTHDLVVSMVGYYPRTKQILINEGQKIKRNMTLEPHLYELPPVEVLAERPRQWLKDYEKFKTKLFGKSEFSTDCKIENPEILEFSVSNDNVFFAVANEPLIIVNEALGYKIDFVLISFKWKQSEGKLRYIYRTRFHLLETQDKKELLKWRLNREKAYNGSVRHFLYNLIQNKTEDVGFKIYHVNEVDIKRPLKIDHQITDPTKQLLTIDHLTNEYILNFTKFIKIIYSQETMLNIHSKPIFQVSWLKMKNKAVTIDLFGDPQGTITFELYGYWADFGVSEMVPKYYVP